MLKKIRTYLCLTIFIPILQSCVGGFSPGVTTREVIPMPKFDTPITSVEYYKSKYNVDLLIKYHDMQKEIKLKLDAEKQANEIAKKIIVSKYPQKDAHDDFSYLYNSIKIGSNDYVVRLKNIKGIKPQEQTDYCWASCVQYFILHSFNKTINQKTIVNKIKKNKNTSDQSASTMEILKSLGYIGLTLSPNNSNQIIKALGSNFPVMIGIKSENDDIGHAIIIVEARYSFVNRYYPSFTPQGNVAFSEFTVLDPDPQYRGQPYTIRASEIENRIDFVLSYEKALQRY